MVWPFSRKKDTPAAQAPREKLTGPRAEGADKIVVDQIILWFQTEHPQVPVRQDDDQPRILVGDVPTGIRVQGTAPAGALLKVKKGKLSWVDLYDPNLRTPVNQLVKWLDKQQRWYFNGVISTKYDETART